MTIQARSEDTTEILEYLVGEASSRGRAFASIDEWWPHFRTTRQSWSAPIDQALAGGLLADRVGYAFAAGYQAALRRMDPELPRDRLASFSVTEEGGGHPRAVQSRLTPTTSGGYRLSGKKKWATMSSGGGVALVVASIGADDAGRNRLKVARVDLAAAGVTVVRMPETPFSPEIPHCRLEFSEVAVPAEALLPGDGYERFVKPFRTIEDIHVSAAILTYLFGIAVRHEWPRAAAEQLLQLLVSLRTLAQSDPSSSAVHLALEGVFKSRHKLLEVCGAHWGLVPAEVYQRWQRDSALSGVAGAARERRGEIAWAKLGASRREPTA